VDDQFANDFYGGSSAEPPAGQPASQPSAGQASFLNPGTGPNAGKEQIEEYAGGIYRENNEGSAPTSYDTVLDGFFGGKEYLARLEDDVLRVESLQAARKGAGEVLRAFEVGETGAREIFNLFNDYMENPRSEETIEAKGAETEAALMKEWGHDAEKMVRAAQTVLKEAAKSIPNLIDMVNRTGLGNDITFVRRLAYIGKRRGFAK